MNSGEEKSTKYYVNQEGQYTETGQVPGVEGNVDLDLFFEE